MRRDERGFALLIVVAVLAIMAAIVADFVTLARTSIAATSNELELARAREFAEAGYALALDDLVNPALGHAPKTDGEPRVLPFGGGRITITIEDESGKIDLNWAPLELLQRLLDGLELPGGVEGRILSAVTERRAAAPLPRYAPGDIAASALLGGPTLAQLAAMPFASVDELQPLARVDPATFARVRPALTVYAQSRRVNVAVAPRAVLLALPGVNAAMADAIMAARGTAGGVLPTAAPEGLGVGAGGAGSLRAVTIVADAVTVRGVRFVRRAVVTFTGAPQAPVRVLEWREDE